MLEFYEFIAGANNSASECLQCAGRRRRLQRKLKVFCNTDTALRMVEEDRSCILLSNRSQLAAVGPKKKKPECVL